MASKSTSNTAQQRAEARAQLAAQREERRAREARTRRLRRGGIAVAVLLAATGGLYAVFQHSNSTTGSYSYQVGSPGIGAQAPGFDLPSTTGGKTSLAQFKGKSVLLYFQEGLDCQPCWDQLAQIQQDTKAFTAAGVDQVVSITTDPANLLAQKAADMHLTIPVLSDPDMALSVKYNANQYGMMGTSADGHSFILVGPTGKIEWRADYGGAPNYTMDVPVATLLADLKAGKKR